MAFNSFKSTSVILKKEKNIAGRLIKIT